jgi:hypothetical protein
MAARDVLGAGDDPAGHLLALAHVDQRDAAVAVGPGQRLVDFARIDLGDLALDLADELRAGRAHTNLLKGGRLSLLQKV